MNNNKFIIKRDITFTKDDWFDFIKENEITDIDHNKLLGHKLESFIEKETGKSIFVKPLTNGTSSLFLGFIASGIKKHTKCLLPSYSFPAAKVVLNYLGADIDYIDIKKDTLCMDPELLKKYLNNDRSVEYVIFINHLGYIGEDLFEIKNICDYYNVTLIEDSAHGLGQTYENKMAGTVGKFGIYSFSGTKLLRCGEGGCIISSDENLINTVNDLANMGIGNYIMSPMSALFLSKQVDDIEILFEKRNQIYEKYKYNNINLHSYKTDNKRGYHAYAYLLKKPISQIKKLITLSNIEFRYFFYKPFSENKDKYPIAFDVYNKYIEIPQSFNLSDDEINKISKFILSVDKK